jgi:hypothetical protein
MLLRMGFTNLYFGRAVMTDSSSQIVAMAHTEYSTVGENPMVTPKGKIILVASSHPFI